MNNYFFLEKPSEEINHKRSKTLFTQRNFFGVSKVTYNAEKNTHEYHHGTTLHGKQSQDLNQSLFPMQYYHYWIQHFKEISPTLISQSPMAMVGLGAGTLTCFAQEKQQIDIYEINPAVVEIAQNNDLFTYLRECSGEKKIILGDARLTLQKAKADRYGIVFMDAYSSDSLPVHLLTEEAFTLYLDKLKKDGILVFHISNRHLDLKPVLQGLAQHHNMKALLLDYNPEDKKDLVGPSEWVMMAQNIDNFGDIETLKQQGWKTLEAKKTVYWTDNFSSILPILK